MLNTLSCIHNKIFNQYLKPLDGLPLLALRIYLAPIFILAGYGKLVDLDSIAAWFGNEEWGLGLPFPYLMAVLAGSAEFFGGILLVLGLGTRYAAVPLMLTMVVAAVTAHWQFGWHALPETKLTVPWEWRTDLIDEALIRKERAESILQEYGNFQWLTAAGSVTILKNGIEFAATYFFMLLALLFYGGGRYVSADYWLHQYLQRKS